MAVEGQTDSMFAGNYHLLRWAGLLQEDGVSLIDLTLRIVKFSLTRFTSQGVPVYGDPLLDFSSADVGSPVTIPNPVTGNPHVLVELLPVHTATLAPAKDVEYYCELEVFEADLTRPVVVATLTLTIKGNVVNA